MRCVLQRTRLLPPLMRATCIIPGWWQLLLLLLSIMPCAAPQPPVCLPHKLTVTHVFLDVSSSRLTKVAEPARSVRVCSNTQGQGNTGCSVTARKTLRPETF
jgi:hypothetical protein